MIISKRTSLLLFASFLINNLLFSQNKDCFSAMPICQFGTYHFEKMGGFGEEQTFDNSFNCFNGSFKESNSKWIVFEAVQTGTVTFTLDPHVITDDIDFIVFEGSPNCSELKPIRCMASGETVGVKRKSSNLPCTGATGLNLTSVDEFESSGCKFKDDNFLRYLQVVEGDTYRVLVNNFHSVKGFSLTIEGTAMLKEFEQCSQITNVNEQNLYISDLYPNPVNTEIRLDFISSSSSLALAEILDFSGRIVQSTNLSVTSGLNREKFNVSQLPQGSYLFRIQQNGFTSTKQFIKQ